MNFLQSIRPKAVPACRFAILLLAAWSRFVMLASAQSTDSQAYTFTTLAGYPGIGSADGIGSAAEFDNPVGITVDKEENIYVADSYNNTIRKITPAGLVSTFAGSAGIYGATDGTGGMALFSDPQGLAADGSGNIYVADGSSKIRKITPTGVVSTIAGGGGFSLMPVTNLTNLVPPILDLDGIGTNAAFNGPQGLAVDGMGNIYVADAYNNLIREITPVGSNWIVSTIAGNKSLTNTFGQVLSGSTDGPGTNAQFFHPSGIAVDRAGYLYVTDCNNQTIREVSPVGSNWMVTTIAGQTGISGQDADGEGTNAQFNYPFSITVDNASSLYVADTHNNKIRKMTLVGTNWMVSTLAGSGSFGSDDGTTTNAQFFEPEGVTVDATGNVYVADTGNNKIRKIRSAGVVSTIAGLAGSQGSVDGVGNAARFGAPIGVGLDSAGNIYVADGGNDAIRFVTSLGEVSTIAGLPGTPGNVDGAGSNARLYDPFGVAVDTNGNIFVADTANCEIRLLTQGGQVTTIAGNAARNSGDAPIGGSVDGNGTNAQFYNPFNLAVDGADNIYVADSYDCTIRKITPVGTNWMVTTIAGNVGMTNSIGASLGGTNDGTGTNAQFSFPSAVALDAAGNLYVADSGNGTIRKITPVATNWIVSTIAGQPGNDYEMDGTNSSALFEGPGGIAVDTAGNLYVTDSGANTIRKITPVGTNWVVTTIGGLAGVQAGSTDGAGSAALFNDPIGIAVDSAGFIYVADSGNRTIRKGSFTQFGATSQASYSQPPMTGQLQVTLLPAEAGGQWRFPWEQAWRDSGSIVSNLPPGSYAVEFRSIPGYVALPPNLDSVNVAGSGVTSITNQYYPTLNISDTTNTGGLTVNIGPNLAAGSGWRFVGTSSYNNSGTIVTNLSPDTYFIEFAPVSGFSPPASQGATVYPGEVTSISVNYTLAQSVPSSVSSLPVPVTTNEISDLTDYPFGFNGQLQTDVGYGSGVAVSTNVVLTAAHLVFNDETLSYVNQAYWFWQQEPGQFTEVPQQAEGWYVLSGYAAQRTNDLQLLNYSPDESSPQSRNEDVAALYFSLPVAGGSYGGYLPSDAQPNTWLTSTANKMLVGYPVDGSVFGVSVTNGQMYEVGPQPYPLTLDTELVTNQQEVYTATWFLSYPGNSGGPFYVQLNGYYYPAGVYLGTLYNGIQPYASLVRGIDSNVVNLINLAAALGSGTNNSGGVIILEFSGGISALNPGRINMQLGPAAAVAEGGAWGFAGPNVSYLNATNSVLPVTTTNMAFIQFKPIPGWTVPASQNVSVTNNATTVITANYTMSSPTMLAVDSSSRLGLTGTIGTTYAIQSRASLTSGSWTSVSTNAITNSGFNLALQRPANNQTIFYRAVWLP